MSALPLEMLLNQRRLDIATEGFENKLYKDTKGLETIGIGYNIGVRGLPDDVIYDLHDGDVIAHNDALSRDYPWYAELTEARRCALINMCLMGYKNFQKFEKMLDALSKHDYVTASKEVLNSKWAADVKEHRAMLIANIIRTGEFIWDC